MILAEPDEELPPINQILEEATKALPMLQPEKAEKTEKPVPVTKPKISPLARKLDEERGIDGTKIDGSRGRIVKEDVLKVIEEMKVVPEFELVRVAKVMAARKLIEKA